jgi:uncharacterized membrane protein YgcG
VGAAIGFWVALSLAVPASLRPINFNLLALPTSRPPAPQAPKTLPPAFFTTPIPKPPPPPAWVRAMFGDPDRPPSGSGRGGHGGSHGFGHGFGGGHGHGGGCHGGGHR